MGTGRYLIATVLGQPCYVLLLKKQGIMVRCCSRVDATDGQVKQTEISQKDVKLDLHASAATVYSNPLGADLSSTVRTLDAAPTGPAGAAPNGPVGAAPTSPSPSQLLTCPVEVHVHHMGQFSFKGTSDKFELCQACPASLSDRRTSYLDIVSNSNGKLVCGHKDDSMALSVSVMLPDILQLPLAAEPPLYINVTQAEAHTQGSLRSSGRHTRTTGARTSRLTRMTSYQPEPV